MRLKKSYFTNEEKLVLFYSGVILAIVSIALCVFLSGCGNSDHRDCITIDGLDFNDCSVHVADCGTGVSEYRAVADLIGELGALVILTGGPCPYCKKEIERVVSWYEYYHSRGIEFIHVVLSDPEQNFSKESCLDYACELRRSYGVTFISAADDNMVEFRDIISAVPDNFVIDKNGRILARITGFNESTLRSAIELLFK